MVATNYRKINYRRFYEELGKLLYAIAKSDGEIKPKEIKNLHEIVKKVLVPFEDSVDEYGTDRAFYSDFMFEIEDEQFTSVEDAFTSFTEFMQENSSAFDEELRRTCLRVVEELAHAYRGTNKKEQPLIEELKKQLHHLAIARKIKILIPTDFSPLSKVAINYAENLTEGHNAHITLLNVIQLNGSIDTSLLSSKAIEDTLMNNAEQDLRKLSDQILRSTKTKGKKEIHDLSYNVIKGYNISKSIEEFAREKEIDLIIMGTKGASGIKKMIIGSNAADIIEHSPCPVLTIPEKAFFKKSPNVMYATDLENADEEIDSLVTYAKLLNASIHIVHFYPEQTPPKKNNTEKMITEWIRKNHYDKISYDAIADNNVEQGIENFIREQSIDILAMFIHRRSFFNKIFNKSLTKEMSFHTHIPLFTFRKNTSIAHSQLFEKEHKKEELEMKDVSLDTDNMIFQKD